MLPTRSSSPSTSRRRRLPRRPRSPLKTRLPLPPRSEEDMSEYLLTLVLSLVAYICGKKCDFLNQINKVIGIFLRHPI